MWHSHTTEYNSASKKKEILPLDNTDESWEHYAKGNKPITERQISYNSTYTR